LCLQVVHPGSHVGGMLAQDLAKLLIGCPFVGIVYFEYGGRCLDH